MPLDITTKKPKKNKTQKSWHSKWEDQYLKGNAKDTDALGTDPLSDIHTSSQENTLLSRSYVAKTIESTEILPDWKALPTQLLWPPSLNLRVLQWKPKKLIMKYFPYCKGIEIPKQ